MSSELTRRRAVALGATSLLAACSTAPTRARASVTVRSSGAGGSGPDVVVIGAGAAGLAAAAAVAAGGASVQVVESRDRIGGRIHTGGAWADLPVDLGASWFHGREGNPVTDLAVAAGLRLVPTSYDSGEVTVASSLRRSGLTSSDDQRWEALVQAAVDAIPAGAADVSVLSAVRAHLGSGALAATERADLAFYLAATYESEWGADADALSARFADQGKEFAGADVLVPQGYSKIAQHLARGLDIRLSTRVTGVSAQESGVTVRWDGGSVSASAAIVTVPLAVLQAGAIDFAPGLTTSMQTAIGRLGVGVLSKTFVRYAEPFWPTDVDWHEYLGVAAGQWTEWVSLAKVGPPVLLGFNSGRHGVAIEAASAAEVSAAADEVLRDMFGSAIPKPVAVQTSAWSTDLDARGSYSYNRVGSTPDDRRALAEPLADRILWAGEATEPDYHSTVHGAVLSGRRAARQALELLAARR